MEGVRGNSVRGGDVRLVIKIKAGSILLVSNCLSIWLTFSLDLFFKRRSNVHPRAGLALENPYAPPLLS